jgi:hypothetical protein
MAPKLGANGQQPSVEALSHSSHHLRLPFSFFLIHVQVRPLMHFQLPPLGHLLIPMLLPDRECQALLSPQLLVHQGHRHLDLGPAQVQLLAAPMTSAIE